MLPLIAAAGRKLLAGGNPYDRVHPFQAGVDALDVTPAASPLAAAASGAWVAYVPPWLPGLWLPYVPATWAGIDLRLVGLGAALAVAVLLGVARWSPAGEPDRASEEPLTARLRLLAAGGLLLAPAAVWFGAIGHTQTYWCYLVAALWALSRRR